MLESVAAIFRQTIPDLPMPVRMTRPRHSHTSVTATAKRSSRRSARARTAAASVSRTLRARVRSGMRLDDPIKLDEAAEERLELIEAQRVGGIALGRGGVLVDLHEDGVHAGRDSCLRQRLDVFG